jgi:hypothetical protein
MTETESPVFKYVETLGTSSFFWMFYAALIGSYLPTFRHSLFVLPSQCLDLEDGMTGCPETSVNKCRSTLRNIPEERSPHTAEEAWNHCASGIQMRVLWVLTPCKVRLFRRYGGKWSLSLSLQGDKIWFRWVLKWQTRGNVSSVGCKNCSQSESSPRQSTHFPFKVTAASTWINFGYLADEGSKFFRNVGTNALSYTIQELRLSSMSNTCLIGCGYFLEVNYKSTYKSHRAESSTTLWFMLGKMNINIG